MAHGFHVDEIGGGHLEGKTQFCSISILKIDAKGSRELLQYANADHISVKE